MSLDHTQPYPEARFWNRIAKRYAEKPVPNQELYEAKLTKTNRYLKPHDRVLEIGCGTGTTAIHHAPHAAHILATDISEGMIDIARTKAEAAKVSNIDFDIASIDKLRAANTTFDVILAHNILHLLPNMDQVLADLYGMLKPGGLLISSTPCIKDFMPLFSCIAPIGRMLGIMPYVHVFRNTDLDKWLAATGFVIKERWQPNAKTATYIVASKPDGDALEP